MCFHIKQTEHNLWCLYGRVLGEKHVDASSWIQKATYAEFAFIRKSGKGKAIGTENISVVVVGELFG